MSSNVGGRRPTTQRATFTAQIIGLVTPGTKRQVRAMCERFGVSQSVFVRRCIDAGLPLVEQELKDERAAEHAARRAQA